METIAETPSACISQPVAVPVCCWLAPAVVESESSSRFFAQTWSPAGWLRSAACRCTLPPAFPLQGKASTNGKPKAKPTKVLPQAVIVLLWIIGWSVSSTGVGCFLNHSTTPDNVLAAARPGDLGIACSVPDEGSKGLVGDRREETFKIRFGHGQKRCHQGRTCCDVERLGGGVLAKPNAAPVDAQGFTGCSVNERGSARTFDHVAGVAQAVRQAGIDLVVFLFEVAGSLALFEAHRHTWCRGWGAGELGQVQADTFFLDVREMNDKCRKAIRRCRIDLS